ncbi:MAG: glycosyltransferase [Acidobacteriota bacterium]
MTARSLLIVNYRSAALTANAVRSAREASSLTLQVVIVDNSCDPAEAGALRGVGDELVVAERNLGYAGGINRGRKSCAGEVIVVSNPDVIFTPGCIDLLADALTSRVAVAGPALFWDDRAVWHLPPSDLFTGRQKLDEILASRSRGWAARRDRRRFRERVSFWALRDPTPVRSLSGAVMAIRTSELDEAGGFDERFPLYFEETDFLRRMTGRGREILYVPAAQCRHLFNQSAGQNSAAAAERFADSELRYLEKWNGPFLARAAKALERPAAGPAGSGEAPWSPGPTSGQAPAARPSVGVNREGIVVEASPLASFATAAGCFAEPGVVSLPQDVWESWRGGMLYMRSVVAATGEVLAVVRAVK